MAGHSEAVFRNFYDQNVMQTTRNAIMSIEQGKELMAPVETLDLPSSSVGVERKIRMDAVKEKYQNDKDQKKLLRSAKQDPLLTVNMRDLVESGLSADFQWIDKSKVLSSSNWSKFTFELLCHEDSSYFRECLLELLQANSEILVRVVSVACVRLSLKSKTISPSSSDSLCFLFNWLHGKIYNLSHAYASDSDVGDGLSEVYVLKENLRKYGKSLPKGQFDRSELMTALLPVGFYDSCTLDKVLTRASQMHDWFVYSIDNNVVINFNRL